MIALGGTSEAYELRERARGQSILDLHSQAEMF